MKHMVSYSVELKHNLNAVNNTVLIYRAAVNWLLDPVKDHYEELLLIEGSLMRQQFIERLVHSTKDRKAVYPFDECFYKFPSYLRRSAITQAIGAVFSWKSNLKNWEEDGRKGNEPRLGVDMDVCPCLYHGNMFLWGEDGTAQIKVYINHDWVWRSVTLRKTDLSYLEKRRKVNEGAVLSSPTIEKKPKGHFFLRFTITEEVELNETPIEAQKVCAVDLGINTDAVCAVIDVHGTVLARKFINCGSEKDSVGNALHRTSVFQRLHGSHDSGGLWAIAKRRNANLAKLIAHEITEFARENECDVIVFEYLDTSGKKKGSKRQKLTMWKHQDIQKTAESLAHKYGMRLSHVNAWNTSRLAYDGSGKVRRGRAAGEDVPYNVCRFTNGKLYNCDLSASYNLGARYFLRALETERPDLMAEVPEIGSRTRRVLADLWRVNAAMS